MPRMSRVNKRAPAPKRQARPRPAPRPARKPRAGGAPKSKGKRAVPECVFSPYSPSLVPTPVNEGFALAVPGIIRVPVDPVTANRKIFCFGNTGASGSVCFSVNNTATPGLFTWTIPTLAASATTGGPTSGRAMKFGIELCNTTALLNCCGNIYVMVSKQRFALASAPGTMTQADWTALSTTIMAHPETRMFSCADFVEPRSFFSYPVDDSHYHSYEPWDGTDTNSTFMSHFATWSGATLDPRPMAAIWVVVEAAATAQSLTATCLSSYYTRWPIGTVQAAVQHPVPTESLTKLNEQSSWAQMLGSAGRAAIEVASAVVGSLSGSQRLQLAKTGINLFTGYGGIGSGGLNAYRGYGMKLGR